MVSVQETEENKQKHFIKEINLITYHSVSIARHRLLWEEKKRNIARSQQVLVAVRHTCGAESEFRKGK